MVVGALRNEMETMKKRVAKEEHVTKVEWVAMYKDIGLTSAKMKRWHKIFESRHPAGHQCFLEWLGIPRNEIDEIRAWSR
jgi:hypothetical protein